jgi:diguanylate cyclase
MKRSTLQRVLVIPFVILVLSLGGVIYLAAQRSGEHASHEFSRTVLLALVDRVGQATDRHLLGAHIAIKAVAPEPVFSPADASTAVLPFSEDLDILEQRMWAATGFFPTINNYVYFGAVDGRFVGVNRHPERIELRLQPVGGAARSIYSMSAPGQRLGKIRLDNYDARTRPWFKSAIESGRASWSEVYTDFTSLEPTITLAKPVYRGDNSLIGVVATDMALSDLTEFMRSLTVSRNGVAFIMERSGALIATSSGEAPFRIENNALQRLMAHQSASPLLRHAYAAVSEWQREGWSPEIAQSREVDGPMGSVQVGAAVQRDSAGLDWITVVAVPRADFITNISSVLYESLAIGLVAVFLVLVLGFTLLQWVLRDIRKLTVAANRIGLGEPLAPLGIRRTDEIGELARSFQEMERSLRIDNLTGVLNRESLMAQISLRMRRSSDASRVPFALLFIDLDGFKDINDSHGHDAGDRILIDSAARLKSALRATDQVARFGGDEFVAYLDGIGDERAAAAVRDKIMQALETPIALIGGAEVHVGASIGMAFYPADGLDLETLLKMADNCMFEQKRSRKTT